MKLEQYQVECLTDKVYNDLIKARKIKNDEIEKREGYIKILKEAKSLSKKLDNFRKKYENHPLLTCYFYPLKEIVIMTKYKHPHPNLKQKIKEDIILSTLEPCDLNDMLEKIINKYLNHDFREKLEN